MLMKLFVDWRSCSDWGSIYKAIISVEVYDNKKNLVYSLNSIPLTRKEAYNKKENNYDPNFKNLANIIDTFNITEVECSDYLGKLFLNSYIGNIFTYDKKASDYVIIEDVQYSYTVIPEFLNIFNNLKLFIAQSFLKEKGEKWNNKYYFNQNKNFDRFCKTLLENIDNNLDFFKDLINECYNNVDNYSCEIAELLTFCLMISSNKCLITKEETKKYFENIDELILKNKCYTYERIFDLSCLYRPTFGYYDINEIEDHYDIKYKKDLSQIIINHCVQFALNSKNKPTKRFLDELTEFIIQSCIKEDNIYSHWRCNIKEDVIKYKNLIDTSLIDFSNINNFDKFINLIINKNKKRSKPKEALLFGYLICPDKFNWSIFNTQVILNYLPENPNTEEVNKIPPKYFDSIDALSKYEDAFVARGFTFLNMVDEKTLKENIDLISYNIFKSINSSRYLYTVFVNRNIYYKNSKKENKLINEENMKLVFENVTKYYAENGDKRQITKYLDFLEDCFPKDFVKLDYPKIKKVIMENKLKK